MTITKAMLTVLLLAGLALCLVCPLLCVDDDDRDTMGVLK